MRVLWCRLQGEGVAGELRYGEAGRPSKPTTGQLPAQPPSNDGQHLPPARPTPPRCAPAASGARRQARQPGQPAGAAGGCLWHAPRCGGQLLAAVWSLGGNAVGIWCRLLVCAGLSGCYLREGLACSPKSMHRHMYRTSLRYRNAARTARPYRRPLPGRRAAVRGVWRVYGKRGRLRRHYRLPLRLPGLPGGRNCCLWLCFAGWLLGNALLVAAGVRDCSARRPAGIAAAVGRFRRAPAGVQATAAMAGTLSWQGS